MRLTLKPIILLVFFMVIACSKGLAQQKDEIQDKKDRQIEVEVLEKQVLEQRKEELAPKKEMKKYRFNSSMELEAGYETNPRLSTIRKSDKSGRFKYSAYYKRLLTKDFVLSVNYDLDATGYSNFTDLTNILNHGRISINKPLNKFFTVGSGYDFSSFYYPKDKDSGYVFHKGHVYLRHKINSNIYHQITLEEGVKNFVHAKAYLDSTSTYLEDKRQDFRHALEYSLGLDMIQKTMMKIRLKYYINDSNALFQDYHDYKALDITPSINYKISEKLGLNLSMTYSNKRYQERLVANSSDTRYDQTFSPNVGLSYNLNKTNVINLGYGYTQNVSNDPTAEYSSSAINYGWLHNF